MTTTQYTIECAHGELCIYCLTADDRRLRTREAAEALAADIVETWDADSGEAPVLTVRPVEIEVLGLGGQDWTAEAIDDGDVEADRYEWERYGTVCVCVDGTEYDVGCVIGVPEYLRGTATAAGGSLRPYLDAWWADASDHGPLPAWAVDAVLAAIYAARHRLWAEAR